MKPAKVKVITPPNGVVQMCGAMVASAASMEHPHGAASQAAWDEMRIFFTKKMVENAMDFVSWLVNLPPPNVPPPEIRPY